MLFTLISTYFGTLCFLVHSLTMGSALLKVLHFSQSTQEHQSNWLLRSFFAISTGIFINIGALFFLGMTSLLTPLLIYSVLGSLFLLAIFSHRKHLSYICEFLPTKNSKDLVNLLFLILFFSYLVLMSLHPPGYWDDTMYHLPLARHYLQEHSLALNEYLRFPLVPQNINLLIALGLQLNGDVMAQTFANLPLFVMAIGLLGIFQKVTNSLYWGAFSIVALMLLVPVKSTLGYAYIDNGLALFCFGAALALASWVDDKQRHQSWLVIAGLLMGAAIGSKYFGLVLAAVMACFILVTSRNLKSTFIFGLIAFFTGSWWYLRSYLISGDPIHPVGGHYFGFFLWDATDFLNQANEQSTHGVGRNPLDLISALKKAGVIIWTFAFAGIFLRAVPTYIRLFQIIFIAYFCFWFFVSQVDRYLAPIFGVGTVLTIYTLFRISIFVAPLSLLDKYLSLRKFAHTTCTSFALTAFAVLVMQGSYKAYVNLINWKSKLEQQSGYSLYSEANKLTPLYGNKLVQLGFENGIYYFHGRVIGDWFGIGRYSAMIECPNGNCGPLAPDDLARYIQGFSSRMIMISTERFPNFNPEDYSRRFKLLKKAREGVLLGLIANEGDQK